MNKVYVLEGTYHSIEDSSTKSLYVFKTRYMAELYQSSIEKTLEDFRKLYKEFCKKHDFYWGYREFLYVERLARGLKKKKPEFFWLDVFKGLDYYDYTPTFRVRELDFIGDFK
jgi:hypothetical protein